MGILQGWWGFDRTQITGAVPVRPGNNSPHRDAMAHLRTACIKEKIEAPDTVFSALRQAIRGVGALAPMAVLFRCKTPAESASGGAIVARAPPSGTGEVGQVKQA